jgi:hypothetical protein
MTNTRPSVVVAHSCAAEQPLSVVDTLMKMLEQFYVVELQNWYAAR